MVFRLCASEGTKGINIPSRTGNTKQERSLEKNHRSAYLAIALIRKLSSMLLKVHDKDLMAIMPLWRMIFKFTFDKKACAYHTQRTIEEQLLKWNGFIKINKAIELEKYGLDPEMEFVPVGRKGTVLDEFEYQLGLMCSWVVREEKGEFQPTIDTYIRAKVDWHLVQPMCKVFPEYAGNRNMERGRRHLTQNMKDFPEIYKNIKRLKGV